MATEGRRHQTQSQSMQGIDGVTCCCGEHLAGSERDALPLIEEASRDQLGALEPEEPYMAREPDVKYLKGALQGKSYIVSL
ncbi:hypothetical protein EYF80_015836 [Liparis tanakae]|uniref:Uncharacterized protein n=1 Tax=Liparis tanakae TaxID=230148 RepID=A0A4Z2I9D2_9TELE|nr:hypothetical protein EYF80_015836 [Liparis tanakae]